MKTENNCEHEQVISTKIGKACINKNVNNLHCTWNNKTKCPFFNNDKSIERVITEKITP